jgi:hypothetical protein
MPTGTIVKTWQDTTNGYMALRVNEGGTDVEYLGVVPLASLAGLTSAQKRATLVAACKAQRDAQQATTVDLGLSGTATI